MFLYLVLEQTLWSEDVGCYRTYGIECWELVQQEKRHIISISDISGEEKSVESLAELWTLYQLHPVHIRDALDNALASL